MQHSHDDRITVGGVSDGYEVVLFSPLEQIALAGEGSGWRLGMRLKLEGETENDREYGSVTGRLYEGAEGRYSRGTHSHSLH